MVEFWISVSYLDLIFFKQKTAYEVRISDWSSDVCSSDLGLLLGIMENYGQAVFGTQWRDVVAFVLLVLVLLFRPTGILGESLGKRSEEHTSELQSLMRISYAVFCLTKKRSIQVTIQITNNDCKKNRDND